MHGTEKYLLAVEVPAQSFQVAATTAFLVRPAQFSVVATPLHINSYSNLRNWSWNASRTFLQRFG